MHEIDDTKASAADDRFEEILRKIKAAGAEITRDEESPLYADFGRENFEIGVERIVEFNINGMDFRIKRDMKTVRVGGAGQRKHMEDLPTPQILLSLKRKPETSDQWVTVDIDEMF